MPHWTSYDGTDVHYRVLGDGPPLVCIPGGPGRAVSYLGDLGGVDATRQLVLLDPRGVGASADPADPRTLRVDRLVDDVESLRAHLGLDRIDLLAHSAGAVLATLYAARFPDRLSGLLLITPGLAGLGVQVTEQHLRTTVQRSAAEPWHRDALAALEKIMGGDLSPEAFRASRPLFYGRWDAAAAAHAMVGVETRHRAAREGYFAGVSLDVPALRAALGSLPVPVLLYGGEVDPLVSPAMLAEAATAFRDATVVVQPGAGHYPWVDDPPEFAGRLAALG